MTQQLAEEIAIVGLGCRFPGSAENPLAFWDMLCTGRDGISEVPKERWDVRRYYDPDPNKPGKVYVKHGGYLRQPVEQMDALFFGISPREAESLDPQQRVLLEVAWEALEDAGIPPDSLAGSRTAVFIGGFIIDHMAAKTGILNRDLLNTHGAVSFTHTILSARIAYLLDLHGPCMTLDTACSSSLVALHQACQAIRNGEAEQALVGGVNIMYRPETPMAMCKSQFLAKDGRSKSFDERGDGYGRGEGAGIVVLKPLSAAQRDGDLVYAVVRGTGINQDGRTDGITVPNDAAQAGLIEEVCQRAAVRSQDISYFEAHGTGTAVGDPKECAALGKIVGQDRSPEQACWLGSVKANIGHLEAAAGVAGVIKTSLILHHRQVPPVANLQNPNPAIDFEALGLRLPRQLEPLNAPTELPLAGINSFGYGGTNAHVILQGVEKSPAKAPQDSPNQRYFLPLSARSESALQELAGRYQQFLAQNPELNLHDVCWSAATRRQHHHVRLGLHTADRAELLEQLQIFAEGKGTHLATAKLSQGQAAQNPVFVFTGMGPQWWAMGRELLASEPVFRETAERCDALFQKIAGWSILEEMTRDEADSRMMETQITQPANFVLQTSLDALWRSKGIIPAAIVGHSVGDVSAAYASGVLSLEDALKVSYQRSRLQKTVAGQGKMLAVTLAETEAQALVEEYGADKISFGAINSPSSLTLSGDAETLEAIAEKLEAKGIFNRFLRVELAYHSPVMEALEAELMQVLADLKPGLPQIPLYSTVTGEKVESVLYDAAYWYANIRQPVYFAKAAQALSRDGHSLFLEVCPHPVLGNAIKENLAAVQAHGAVVFSLKRQTPDAECFYDALAQLYAFGAIPDWQRLYPQGGSFVRLPLYPWQRQRYWQESEAALFDRLGDHNDHPLLGHRQDSPEPAWEQRVNGQFLPWLSGHKIQNLVILPGAAYVEIGLTLLELMSQGQTQGCLENLQFERALVINPLDEPILHTRYNAQQHTYAIYSRPRDAQNWSRHAQGRLSQVVPPAVAPLNLAQLQQRLSDKPDVNALYLRLAGRGLQYGEAFQGIQEIWRGEDELLTRVALRCDEDIAHYQAPEDAEEADSKIYYHLHPTQLDAVFQAFISLLDDDDDSTFVPVSIGEVRFYQRPGLELWAHGRMTLREADRIEADLCLLDAEGQVLVEIRRLSCRSLSALGEQSQAERNPQDWIYQVGWDELPPPNKTDFTGPWLMFMDQGGRLEALAQAFEAAQMQVTRVRVGDSFALHADGSFQVPRQSAEALDAVFEQASLERHSSIIFGWGLDCDLDNDPDGRLSAVDWLRCLQIVGKTSNVDNPLQLCLLTTNAQPVGTGPFNPAGATLIGLGRVAVAEYFIRGRLIDMPAEAWSDELLAMLMADLQVIEPEVEVALRNDGKRSAYRLQLCPAEQLLDSDYTQAFGIRGSDAFVLEHSDGHYQWRETQRQKLEPEQVELHLEYAALPVGGLDKQRDALVAVSGQVSNSKSKAFASNTPLTGLVPLRQLSSYAVLPANQILAEPLGDPNSGLPVLAKLNSWLRRRFDRNPKQAEFGAVRRAASLLPFLQAFYALHKLTPLRAGERVLIHACPDNLDLAAAQIARHLQAEIFATYTDPAKAEILRAIGVQHVLPADSSGFADEVLRLTQQRGVHVLLNTLADDLAQKSLSLVAPFGHFIDFSDSADKLVLHGQPNVSLHTVSMADILAHQPQLVQSLMFELKALFEQNILRPLELPLFKAEQVEQAMMVSRKHSAALEIGAADVVSVFPDLASGAVIRKDASYLITGGFGGFGLTLAFWLAEQGAKSLILVGRRGAATEDSKYAMKGLEVQGVKVTAAAADVGKEADVKALLEKAQAGKYPLAGIFHTAGVLDDAMLDDLTPERLNTVMQPKAMGAWYLHQYSKHLPLEHFVLFSSISSLVGKPGQGNYVAANAYLDQLAHARRAEGLPGLSLNWGVLSEVGMAARQNVEDRLERIGIGSFTGAEAMYMLGLALRGTLAQLGLMNVNWRTWWDTNRAPAAARRYGHLLGDLAKEEESPAELFRNELLALPAEERHAHICARLIQLTAAVMRLPEDSIDADAPLSNLGLDSLMGAELQGTIDIQTGVSLSVLDLMQGGSIAELSKKIALQLGIKT